jgi:Protein of unknown function (DUF3237)
MTRPTREVRRLNQDAPSLRHRHRSNPRWNVGDGPLGRLFGAAGGSFEGQRRRGEVLAGGGDWALVRSGGATARDVRLTLRTDDGAVVHMTYGGHWITPSELRADMADPVRRYIRSTRVLCRVRSWGRSGHVGWGPRLPLFDPKQTFEIVVSGAECNNGTAEGYRFALLPNISIRLDC